MEAEQLSKCALYNFFKKGFSPFSLDYFYEEKTTLICWF